MSQMKGIFYSLSQLNLSPSEFFIKANRALSHCLEKKHFITSSYYILDTASRKITFSRAGHCPTLYFDVKKGKSEYLRVGGLGLGIIRDARYAGYVSENERYYSPGDVMILYTDGIVEAKNQLGQEFGYDNLKRSLDETHFLDSTEKIKEKIIENLYDFVGEDTLPEDDYSLLVVKFLE